MRLISSHNELSYNSTQGLAIKLKLVAILWQNDASCLRDVQLDWGRGHGRVLDQDLNLNPGSCRGRAGLVVGRALVPARVLGLGVGDGHLGPALVIVEDLHVVAGAERKPILIFGPF